MEYQQYAEKPSMLRRLAGSFAARHTLRGQEWTTPSPRHEEVGMRHGDVVNLAWDLADALAPTLTKSTRTTLFANLGAGHAEDTIEALLRECGVAHQCLTPELASRVRIWVENYVCPVERPTLRHLVDSITAPPVMPRPKTPVRLVASKRDRRARALS
jgi:hypothetical protein